MSALNEFFVKEVQKNFRFLESAMLLSQNAEITEWGAEVTYAGSKIIVTVTYDNKVFYVNTLIEKLQDGKSLNQKFALWEWLEGLDIAEKGITNDSCVDTSLKIEKVISESAIVLKENLSFILCSGTKIIRKIEAAREVRQQAEDNEMEQSASSKCFIRSC